MQNLIRSTFFFNEEDVGFGKNEFNTCVGSSEYNVGVELGMSVDILAMVGFVEGRKLGATSPSSLLSLVAAGVSVGDMIGFDVSGSLVGLAVVGLDVVGLDVVGLAVVGLAVVGLAVIGLDVVGLSVVGFAVVGLAVGFGVVGDAPTE